MTSDAVTIQLLQERTVALERRMTEALRENTALRVQINQLQERIDNA